MSAAGSVLLFATEYWPNAARLAMRLAASGCVVQVLAPRGNPVDSVRCVGTRHRFRHLRGATDLRRALAASRARLVLPCDDHAAVLLAGLHAQLAGQRDAGQAPGMMEDLLVRSLGRPGAIPLVMQQARLRALAAELRAPMPEAAEVTDAQALRGWMAAHGLPAVLKQDGTWGGLGVAVVRTEAEALAAFARLRRRPAGWESLKRSLLDRDPRPLLAWLAVLCGRPRAAIWVQAFVAGTPANVTVAARHGRPIAVTSAVAARTLHATGPATVIRLQALPAAEDIATRLVTVLGVSGLWGFDFILDEASGRVRLLEANPRATPVSALGVEGPHRLCEAIARQAGAEPPATHCPRHERIALFPREWERDPASAALRTGLHDVPWEEPGLVHECLRPPYPQRGLLARLNARRRRQHGVSVVSPGRSPASPCSRPDPAGLHQIDTLRSPS